MSDFTFLTIEQFFSDDLRVFDKKRKAALTDFSILLGGTYYDDFYLDNDRSLRGRTGFYWTKSDDENNNVKVVDGGGCKNWGYVEWRIAGARPALSFSDMESIPTNGEEGKREEDSILEVEYGYYPQEAADKNMQEILEELYKKASISKTGKSYTTDSRKCRDTDKRFLAKKHEEYEYDGKRYVRVEANSSHDGYKFKLSNEEYYDNGDYVWVEVSPVKWWVEEKAKIMITEKIIFAGVQFNDENNYHIWNFEGTNIKKFMDDYFAKDLLQSLDITKQEDAENQIGNTYNLDFSEVSEKDIIRGALQSNVAIFLHGQPGCGKSDRVKQLDPDFIELNLSHLDPELLDGLAGEREGKEVHIKPPWLEELEEKCENEPDKIHILFLEELTNASVVMQAKAYGIALDKKVAGRWKLPENARVVAAGNELEDSLVANEMAEPLYDRFAHVNIETKIEDWLEWAVTPENIYRRIDYRKGTEPKQKIHPAIYGYISYKGDEVLRTPYNKENPKPHADPRRWKMASDMLYASNNPNTLRAIIGEYLTKDFISFCKLPIITIEDVLNGNYTEEKIKDMDIGRKLATVCGLVAVESKDMLKVREFTKKLGPEICKKFEVQWAHGDEEKLEQLQEVIMKEKEEAIMKKQEDIMEEQEDIMEEQEEAVKQAEEYNSSIEK